jgi:hypothetical protein
VILTGPGAKPIKLYIAKFPGARAFRCRSLDVFLFHDTFLFRDTFRLYNLIAYIVLLSFLADPSGPGYTDQTYRILRARSKGSRVLTWSDLALTRAIATADWETRMKEAMAECLRVLKPGRCLSLCYHDTSEGTWALVQDIMAEVRTSSRSRPRTTTGSVSAAARRPRQSRAGNAARRTTSKRGGSDDEDGSWQGSRQDH